MASNLASSKDASQMKMKSHKKNFKKQKQKVFRASEPFISVFMWGVNHSIKELSNVRMPHMLMPDDFKAYAKVRIDNHMYNKENLPSHFKVKEYCPLVFKRLRELFGIDDKDFVNSLCVNQPKAVEDRGRSSVRFLHSCDHKFVIKTLTSEDIGYVHGFLPNYHQYIVECNRKTLLPQYLGMYRLTSNGSVHYLIVMRNIFSSRFKAHRKYDLKGSTIQREASVKEKMKEFPTFKDNDFVRDNVKIYLDVDNRTEFLQKLKNDVDFLSSLKLMDYSLLVGLHDCEKGRQLGYPDETESDENEIPNGSPILEEPDVLQTPPDSVDEDAIRCDYKLEEEEEEDNYYAFQAAAGSPRSEIYYMGLIDALTQYDTKKKAAHAMKTAKHGHGAEISSVQPSQYGRRFYEFICENVIVPEGESGGNGG